MNQQTAVSNPGPAPQPFTTEEVQSMREAAEEDRHLARVVATVDALTPQPLTDEEFKSLCSRIALSSHAAAMSDVHTLMRHARAKSAQLRAAEQRAAAAEGERDTLRTQLATVSGLARHFDVPTRPDATVPERHHTGVVAKYREVCEAAHQDLAAERSRAETAEARAGRLEALLREALAAWQAPGPFRFNMPGFMDRIDAELLATAAQQPLPSSGHTKGYATTLAMEPLIAPSPDDVPAPPE